MSLIRKVAIVFCLVFSVQSHACSDESALIRDFYGYIELLDVNKLSAHLEKIRLICDVSSMRIKNHLIFGELTVADAKNDRKEIDRLRYEILQRKLIDSTDGYFAWKLYVLAQSYYWDGDITRAVELLNKNKYFFDNYSDRTIDIRLAALLGDFFSNANSSLSNEKVHYFTLAESKANQLGFSELMLFVNFRKGKSFFAELANTKIDDSDLLELVHSTEDSVTKGEVLLSLAVYNIGGSAKAFKYYEDAIKIFKDFGVSRSEVEAIILYVDASLNSGNINVADDLLLNALSSHQEKIEPRQLMKIYDLLFLTSQSKQRFNEALKYKENYYRSMVAANISDDQDSALAEYKIQEQANKNKILEQSIKILELERKTQASKLYIVSTAVLSLFIVLLLTAFYLYKNYKLKNKLFELAMIDPLTGVANRRAILETSARELDLAKRTKQNLTVILADLDHFKLINDRYGHATGDAVLKSFASIAKSTLRNVDLFGRFGGEEWLFVLPSTNAIDAQKLFDRISEQLKVLSFGGLNGVTFSMGAVDICNAGDCELDELIQYADQMLYQAKSSGRDKLVVDAISHKK